MPLQFAVSPDFNADRISQWFVFNNWLQRVLGEAVHVEIPADFGALREALRAGSLDLLWANPFDLVVAVREKGFVPIASPTSRSDEAAVVVRAESPITAVTEFTSPPRISCTDAPDVEMIGRILLEPSGLERGVITVSHRPTYVVVAKDLLSGAADAGFFLRRSFDELSALVRSQLRIVASSHIYVVRHALLAGPALAPRREELLASLLAMKEGEKGRELLSELGFDEGWREMTGEDAEFMIDLMETLVD